MDADIRWILGGFGAFVLLVIAGILRWLEASMRRAHADVIAIGMRVAALDAMLPALQEGTERSLDLIERRIVEHSSALRAEIAMARGDIKELWNRVKGGNG